MGAETNKRSVRKDSAQDGGHDAAWSDLPAETPDTASALVAIAHELTKGITMTLKDKRSLLIATLGM